MNVMTRWAQRNKWEREYVKLLSQIGDEPILKVEAHVKYLDEYFLRWLGFCRLETIAPQSLTDNSLFLVVEAASKIADVDITRLTEKKEPLKQAWAEYQKSLVNLRRCPQTVKIESEQSYLKLKIFADIFHQNVSK